jgi:hypothetical protein
MTPVFHWWDHPAYSGVHNLTRSDDITIIAQVWEHAAHFSVKVRVHGNLGPSWLSIADVPKGSLDEVKASVVQMLGES